MSKRVKSKSYIVASCKNWNYQGFLELGLDHLGEWHWASDDSTLDNILTKVRPEYIFFLHWNSFVPDSITSAYKCVCFHMTDVPYGRGGSPLQNLIIRGHSDTKLSALKMVKKMDAGPVYAKRDLKLSGTAQEIYEEAGRISYKMIKWIAETSPIPNIQKGPVVEFIRRQPYQSEIKALNNLKEAYDFIRMLDAEGYPHAYINYGGIKIEFTKAKYDGGELVAQVKLVADKK